jgi:hypothetical protein
MNAKPINVKRSALSEPRRPPHTLTRYGRRLSPGTSIWNERLATHATFHHYRQLDGRPDGERKAGRYLVLSVVSFVNGRAHPRFGRYAATWLVFAGLRSLIARKGGGQSVVPLLCKESIK